MFGEEPKAAFRIGCDHCAAHDERLRVLLVFDLADEGTVVGVGELEGLEGFDVEEAFFADRKPEVAIDGLALFVEGSG